MNESDKEFQKQFCDSLKFVFDHTEGLIGGVLSPQFDLLLKAKFSTTVGLDESEIAKLIINKQVNDCLQKVLSTKKTVKLLAAKSFSNQNIKIFIAHYIPIVNPATNNLVAIWVRSGPIDVFDISAILLRYFKHGETSLSTSNQEKINLTEKEKCVIFFFMLNLESQAIADLMSKLENKQVTKNAIDQILNKRLFLKFNVYNRKSLHEKLSEYGFQRIIPHNILVDGLFFDITDYVVFDN